MLTNRAILPEGPLPVEALFSDLTQKSVQELIQIIRQIQSAFEMNFTIRYSNIETFSREALISEVRNMLMINALKDRNVMSYKNQYEVSRLLVADMRDRQVSKSDPNLIAENAVLIKDKEYLEARFQNLSHSYEILLEQATQLKSECNVLKSENEVLRIVNPNHSLDLLREKERLQAEMNTSNEVHAAEIEDLKAEVRRHDDEKNWASQKHQFYKRLYFEEKDAHKITRDTFMPVMPQQAARVDLGHLVAAVQAAQVFQPNVSSQQVLSQQPSKVAKPRRKRVNGNGNPLKRSRSQDSVLKPSKRSKPTATAAKEPSVVTTFDINAETNPSETIKAQATAIAESIVKNWESVLLAPETNGIAEIGSVPNASVMVEDTPIQPVETLAEDHLDVVANSGAMFEMMVSTDMKGVAQIKFVPRVSTIVEAMSTVESGAVIEAKSTTESDAVIEATSTTESDVVVETKSTAESDSGIDAQETVSVKVEANSAKRSRVNNRFQIFTPVFDKNQLAPKEFNPNAYHNILESRFRPRKSQSSEG